MTLGAYVAAELRAEMARQRISGREMARRLGENPMWVSSRVSGHVPIDLQDLERIARELDVHPRRLLPRVDSNHQPAESGTVIPLRRRLVALRPAA